MEAQNFIQLVKDMRLKQVQYFATRDNGILKASKKLERQVDAAIKEYESPQGSLFNETGDK